MKEKDKQAIDAMLAFLDDHRNLGRSKVEVDPYKIRELITIASRGSEPEPAQDASGTKRIRVTGSRYESDGGWRFQEIEHGFRSQSVNDFIIDVPADAWNRWLKVQDYRDIYESFDRVARAEQDRLRDEAIKGLEDFNRHVELLKTGQYRLEPITQLDRDKERFSHCTTFEEVQAVIASVPPGYMIELSAIPTSLQLHQRREVRDELIRRGIEPGKPARAAEVS